MAEHGQIFLEEVAPAAASPAAQIFLEEVPSSKPAAVLEEIVPKSDALTQDGRFRILDGDTVENTQTGEILRFHGVNSPESGWTFSAAAKVDLKTKLDEAPNAQYKVREKDQYGRSVAEFTDAFGASINERLATSYAPAMSFGGEESPHSSASKQANHALFGADTRRTPEQRVQDYERAKTIFGSIDKVPHQLPREPKATVLQDFASGVKQGTDTLQGSGFGFLALVGDAVGSDGLRQYGMEGYKRNQEEAAKNVPDISRIEDIHGVKDFFHWGAGQLGNAAPSLATMLVGGGVATALGRKAVEKRVRDHITEKAIKDLTEKGIARGLAERAVARGINNPATNDAMAKALATQISAGTGIVATSSVQQQGEIYGNLAEAGIRAPGTSAVFGLAGGILDAGGPAYLIHKLFPGVAPDVAKHWIKKVAQVGGMEMLLEGSTEGLQEIIALAARAKEDPNFKINTTENRMRVYNAAASGALVGAVMGGLAGPFTDGRAPHEPSEQDEDRPDETAPDTTQQDLLAKIREIDQAGRDARGPAQPPVTAPGAADAPTVASAPQAAPAVVVPPTPIPPPGPIVQPGASQEVARAGLPKNEAIPSKSIPQEPKPVDTAPVEEPLTAPQVTELVTKALEAHEAKKEAAATQKRSLEELKAKLETKFPTKIEKKPEPEPAAMLEEVEPEGTRRDMTPEDARDKEDDAGTSESPEFTPQDEDRIETQTHYARREQVPRVREERKGDKVLKTHYTEEIPRPWDLRARERVEARAEEMRAVHPESQFEVVEKDGGLVIEERFPIRAQRYYDAKTGKTLTESQFVEVRAARIVSGGSSTWKSTDRRYIKLAKKGGKKGKSDVVYGHAQQITQLGKDLNRGDTKFELDEKLREDAKEVASKALWAAQIYHGFVYGLGHLALKAERPMNLSDVPGGTIIWMEGGKGKRVGKRWVIEKSRKVWTLDDIRALLRPPGERLNEALTMSDPVTRLREIFGRTPDQKAPTSKDIKARIDALSARIRDKNLPAQERAEAKKQLAELIELIERPDKYAEVTKMLGFVEADKRVGARGKREPGPDDVEYRRVLRENLVEDLTVDEDFVGPSEGIPQSTEMQELSDLADPQVISDARRETAERIQEGNTAKERAEREEARYREEQRLSERGKGKLGITAIAERAAERDEISRRDNPSAVAQAAQHKKMDKPVPATAEKLLFGRDDPNAKTGILKQNRHERDQQPVDMVGETAGKRVMPSDKVKLNEATAAMKRRAEELAAEGQLAEKESRSGTRDKAEREKDQRIHAAMKLVEHRKKTADEAVGALAMAEEAVAAAQESDAPTAQRVANTKLAAAKKEAARAFAMYEQALSHGEEIVGVTRKEPVVDKPPGSKREVTKSGASISEHEVAMVKDLMKEVGLDIGVEIVDEEGLAELGKRDHELRDALIQATLSGWTDKQLGWTVARGDRAVIFISKNVTDSAKRVAILGHELGHNVAAAVYNTLPANHPARIKLKEAHAKELATPGNQTNEDFNEWLANQFVAWAIRRQAPKNIIETFFKKVQAALEKMFEHLSGRYQLNETYAEFLDGIAYQATQGVRRMWIGKHAPQNFTVPAWVSQNKVAELLRVGKIARDSKEFLRAAGRLTVVAAGSWIRSVRTSDGKIWAGAAKLANHFNIVPGTVPKPGEYATDRHGADIKHGMLEEVQRVWGAYENKLQGIAARIDARFEHLPKKERQAAVDAHEAKMIAALHNEKTSDDALGQQYPEALEIRKLLRDMRANYLTKHIPVFGLIENYFPHVFDTAYLAEHEAEFITAVAPYMRSGAQSAEGAYKLLMQTDGHSEEVMGNVDTELYELPPSLKYLRHRGESLKDVPADVLEPFLSKDLAGIMHNYLRSAVKRAESDKRFGDFVPGHDRNGDAITKWHPTIKLERMMARAKRDLPNDAFVGLEKQVMAMRGLLGADLNPRLRHAMGWMMTYQNYRTLLFSPFASIPDMAKMIAISPDLRTASRAFQMGLKAMVASAKGDQNAINELARSMGVVAEAADSYSLQAGYGSDYISPNARKANDWFFKAIGLHHFTQMTRFMALALGKDFAQHHAEKARKGDARSVRYLKQLGITEADVAAWDGRAWDPTAPPSAVNDNAEKMSQALNKWVNSVVLRPDASMRPAWGSDQKYMLIFHLKSFMFAFQQVIMLGTWNEMKARRGEGASLMQQSAPAIALAATLLPLALAGIELRNLLQHYLWGTKPTYDSVDLVDLLNRSGSMGVAALAMDIYEAEERGRLSFLAAGGPTLSQLEQLFTKPWSQSASQIIPVFSQVPGFRAAARDLME